MSIEIRWLTPLIQVFDMPKSIAFYCDLLGFSVTSSSSPPPLCDWVSLSLSGVNLMLNTAYESDSRPPLPDPVRIDAHSDAGLFFGCPDVDAAYEHLNSQGVKVRKPIVTGYGMKQLYVTDPDGYVLCFQWPVE